MNAMELMQMVKQVVEYEEDYELEEIYDGNCFHLTPEELSALLRYHWCINYDEVKEILAGNN